MRQVAAPSQNFLLRTLNSCAIVRSCRKPDRGQPAGIPIAGIPQVHARPGAGSGLQTPLAGVYRRWEDFFHHAL